MRAAFVLATGVAVAALGYLFAPDLVEAYQERESLVAERQVVAVTEDAKQSDPQTFETKRTDANSVRASLQNLRQTVAAATERTAKAAPRRAEPRATERPTKALRTKAEPRRRSAEAERAELKRLGLAPAATDTSMKPSEAVAAVEPVRPRAILSPMAGRWIEDLSGPKARLDIKSRDNGCARAYSHCERPAAPEDLNLAGVVTKTETISRHPKEPLTGKVRRGNYVDATPAVYVE